jgi:PHP family Zn ribbon phosphoesterase
MSSLFCDFHIHSCLSPCADDEMTPANIAAMAMLNRLSAAALTDHNTCKNCPPFFYHAEKFGIIPIAGMELTTSEDVHIVCLFRSLSGALCFDEYVSSKRPNYKNNPDIFGHQYLMNDNDEIAGEEEHLLLNAADISIDEAFYSVKNYGGICFPAHIDRQSNGIVAVLGDFPSQPAFTAYELNDNTSETEYKTRFPLLSRLVKIVSSDAHRLENIKQADFSINIPLPGGSNQNSALNKANMIIDYISGLI